MWLRLTRLYYKLCLQCTEHAVDRWRRIMWVGEQMQRCHYSSTVSKCEHVQQFPFPNNPPQRPPPLMVFLFLSHSSCQSFSRSPSSSFTTESLQQWAHTAWTQLPLSRSPSSDLHCLSFLLYYLTISCQDHQLLCCVCCDTLLSEVSTFHSARHSPATLFGKSCFAFRTGLLLHYTDSTGWWKHSEIWAHVDTIASHSCCTCCYWDLVAVETI